MVIFKRKTNDELIAEIKAEKLKKFNEDWSLKEKQEHIALKRELRDLKHRKVIKVSRVIGKGVKSTGSVFGKGLIGFSKALATAGVNIHKNMESQKRIKKIRRDNNPNSDVSPMFRW